MYKSKIKLLKQQCNSNEINDINDTKDMNTQIDDLTGRKIRLSTSCMKSNTEQVIQKQDAITKKWGEYNKELFGGGKAEFTIEDK